MTAPEGFELLDLHNHTDASYDAVNRLEDYERAHAEGRLHVLAITDHNRIKGALDLAARASFPVIVGEEIDTAEGELIGLFLRERVPAGLSLVETVEKIRAQGGIVYLQHPFYRLVRHPIRKLTIEELAAKGLVDVVEVANGGPFTGRANLRAAAWAAAKGLPAGAGSDAHEPPDVGRCVVAVPPGPLDAASLPGRLREGIVIDRRRNSFAILATKARLRAVPSVVGRLRGAPRRQRL